MEYKQQQLHLKSGQRIKNQQGAVMVILAAGLTALLAVAGLALDGGNLFLNKSKLQNAIDVSALSAGAALNKPGGNYQKAKDSAIDRFKTVIATPGNEVLLDAYNSNEISLTVTTSPTLSPFVGSNADDDWYVRVAVSALQLDSFFLRVIGIDTLSVPATAVAGRTPVGVSDPGGGDDVNPICGVAPMMVCGDPNQVPSEGSDNYWGYTPGETQILKATAQCQAITGDGECVKPATAEDWAVGTGNFQLIQLADADGNTQSGGAAVRDAIAGSEDSCINAVQGEEITTQTGNVVGPVVQGLNTRFGIYNGPLAGSSAEYPSDYVVGQPAGSEMTYEEYQLDYADPDYKDGCPDGCEEYRRIIAVPIGDCSETINGQGEIPLLDMGCFFINKKANQKGNESEVYGQFVTDCPVGVTPPPGEGPTTGTNSGSAPGGNNKNKAYIIQLYKNPNSRDS
jgi:Flp pilus assembly protein TadG